MNTTIPTGAEDGAKTIDNWLQAAQDIERLAEANRQVQAAAATAADADPQAAQRSVEDARNILKAAIMSAAYGLTQAAGRAGYVLEVQQVPVHPPAMGRYSPAVRVWPARG